MLASCPGECLQALGRALNGLNSRPSAHGQVVGAVLGHQRATPVEADCTNVAQRVRVRFHGLMLDAPDVCRATGPARGMLLERTASPFPADAYWKRGLCTISYLIPSGSLKNTA